MQKNDLNLWELKSPVLESIRVYERVHKSLFSYFQATQSNQRTSDENMNTLSREQ